jgi:hypothetical protein
MREILERAQTLFKLCFLNMNSKLHEMSTKYYVVYLLICRVFIEAVAYQLYLQLLDSCVV